MSYYTYIYLDPRKPGDHHYDGRSFTHEPFYVGKGCGNRAYDHMKPGARLDNPIFRNVLNKIRQEGHQPIIQILDHFESEDDAYAAESRLITAIGRRVADGHVGPLTNITPDGRPPCHRGKTYADIYGAEAEEQRTKRHEAQIEAGGYFKGHRHSDATKAKLAETTRANNLRRAAAGEYEGIGAKISAVQKRRFAAGATVPSKRSWIVVGPDGARYDIPREGRETIQSFCKSHGISYATLYIRSFSKGCEIKSGRTKGWKLIQCEAAELPHKIGPNLV